MATSPPPGTVPELTGLLTRVAHVLRTRLTAALAEIGLTPREQCVLVHALEAERTQIQLAELTDTDKTTMVVTIERLEKVGYAERRPCSTDRRARIIKVTKEGERAAAAGQRIVDRVHAEVIASLGDPAGADFAEALRRLAEGPLAKPVECDRPVRRPRQMTR